jgi:hypothetical protein
MGFAVMSFHHADCPLLEIDWCAFGGLEEWICVVELLRCGPLFRILHQALGNYVFQDLREGIALG